MGGWWGKSLALADGNDKILGWSKAAGGRGRRVSRSRRRREEKRDRSGKCSWGSGDARTMLRLWPHNSHMMLRWCLDCNHTFLIWCLDDNSMGHILQKVKLKLASKFGVNLGLKTSTSTSKLPPNITKHHNFTLFYVMPTWTECFRPFPPFYLNFLFQHFFYLHLKESYQGVPIDWEGNTLREYEGKMGCWRRSWEPWLGSRWLTGENTGCPRRLSRAIGNLAEEEAAWGYCLSNAIITPHPRKLL